jgi:hypothetical protein
VYIVISEKVERGNSNLRATDLLDGLLSGEMTVREFFRQADNLSDDDLELLHRMLIEQYWEAQAREAAD